MSFIAVGLTAGGVIGGGITAGTLAAGAGLLSTGIGVAGALGGGSSPTSAANNAAGQLSPAQQINNINSYGNGYSGAFNNTVGQNLFGSFDAGSFFNANPAALEQYNQAIASGGLQGWTPEQFAQAYIGAPGNNPNVGSSTNGAGSINSYSSGGILSTLGQAAPIINQLNSSQNPNIGALQNQFATQAQNGLPANAALGQLNQLTQQGFGGNYQAQQLNPQSLMANTSFSSQQVQAPNSVMQVQGGQVGAQNVQAQGGNSLLNSLLQRGQGTGQDSTLNAEDQSVNSQLALGGQLSPDQLRAVQQSSRAGYAARGLDATNASVTDEALQTQAAQQAMYQTRLANAQGVESQNQGAAGLQNQLGLGASSQALGYGQLGLSGQQSNQQAQLQAQLANQSTGLAGQQSNQAAQLSLGQLGVQAQQYNQAANLQAQGLGLQAQEANQQFGLGAFQANSGASYNAAALNQQANIAQAQAAAQSAGLYQQGQQQNLAAQQLGLSSNLATYQPLDLSSIYGLANSNTNNFVGYGQQNANTLYNGQLNAGIAGSNQNSAIYGGLLGLGGNLLGQGLGNSSNIFGSNNTSLTSQNAINSYNLPTSLAGGINYGTGFMNQTMNPGCWVAREVYGEDNPKWEAFRYWLINRAPDWLRSLYIKRGPRLARLLKTRPQLKEAIKSWMDSQLLTLNPA